MANTLLPLTSLRFGDILLKDSGSPFDLLVKLKTGSDVSHSELFVGTSLGHDTPHVITAFPKGGVDYYPASLEALAYVLRPHGVPSQEAFHWFEQNARGQAYDWAGLLSFYFAQLQGADNNKQFCSEVIARIYKKGGYPLLHARVDADAYSPASFKTSPLVEYLWTRE